MSDDFEIKPLEHDAEVGAIPMGWCISKKLMSEIEGNLNRYKVLIISSPLTPNKRGNKRKEWRGVVPVKDMMSYITFLCPGPNRVFMFLVDMRKLTTTELEYFDMKNNNSWIEDVLSYSSQEVHGDLVPNEYSGVIGSSLKTAQFDIDIPEGCFAKPHPEWLTNWVNLWFKTPAQDQCSFRKRCMIAFTIQPILILLFGIVIFACRYAGGFVAALALLIVGCKNINWKPVYNVNHEIDYIWRDLDGSYFYFPKLPYLLRYSVILLLPVAIAALVISYLFAIDLRLQTHILILILYGIGAVSTITVGVSLWVMFWDWFLFDVLGLVWLGDFAVFRWLERIDRQDERDAWERNRNQRDAELLACQQWKFNKLRDLPRRKRTFKLKFKDTKSKVCKPFPVS